MGNDDPVFLKKLLATFRDEATEHMQAVSRDLLELESSSDENSQAEVIERLFREVHSLKGASRAVGVRDMEKICQAMENRLGQLKRGEASPERSLLDVLHDAVNLLDRLPLTPDAAGNSDIQSDVASLLARLDQSREHVAPSKKSPAVRTEYSPAGEPRTPDPTPSSTVRIATDRLDAVLYMAEELVPEKLVAAQRAGDLWEMHRRVSEWRKRWSKLRSRRSRATALVDVSVSGPEPDGDAAMEEYVNWSRATLESMESMIQQLARTADKDRRKLAASVDELVEQTKKILVQPFSVILDLVPRMVRDLTQELDKRVEVTIKGGDVEVDRRILEIIKDPLIHLIRNAVDHGIEPPAERKRSKKKETGTIAVEVRSLDSGSVELRVKDDGAGIPIDEVRASAERSGVATAGELSQMKESEIMRLIFRSGLTTSRMISDISGRGLGLPILEEQVQKLGGHVDIDSQAGAGTAFAVRLPVTLAAMRGTLVQTGAHVMAVPSTHISRIFRVRPSDVVCMESHQTVRVDKSSVSLVALEDILELDADSEAQSNDSSDSRPALLLGSAAERVALLVDAVVGEQEIRIKPLGTQLERVRNVAGITQLGTGRLAPVLNVTDLIHSAVRASRPRSAEAEARSTEPDSILIAEDSVTSRVLMQNILEGAGYRVTTTADGLEALSMLRQEHFDLVVSDVEMPHMSGFDLTRQIREDESLKHLPVVLVTSLSSTEDRRRGIEAGANAYIVKAEFEQSDLLSVIENLI